MDTVKKKKIKNCAAKKRQNLTNISFPNVPTSEFFVHL